MAWTANDVAWVGARLAPDAYEIAKRANHEQRVKRRLGRLLEELETSMSAIDRIKAKALQARNIAPDAIRAFEADLDGIIAEKSKIAQRHAEAVAPHKETISGIYGEFDGLKQAMDLLSNGGPSLDPLHVSETGVPQSAQQPQSEASLPHGFDLHTRRDRPRT